MADMTDCWYPTAFKHWDRETQETIARVLASDRLTMGAETEAFEHELATYHHRKHAICVNSGSSANLIAVAALSRHMYIRSAVVPALAWATTYAPLVQYGIRFDLLDCDRTWNAPPYSGDFVDLFVGCSILGNPARFDQELPHARAFLNDNCEALGAELYGRPVGAYGDMATLSFYHSHQLSAVEGGAVLTDDDDLADLCRMLRDHGLTRSFKKADVFEEEFDFKLFGYNVRPTDLYSAIGRVQLRQVDEQRVARRKNWHHFFSGVQAARLPITAPTINAGFNPFSIHFTVEDRTKRNDLAYILRVNGIDCRMPVGGSFKRSTYGREWVMENTPVADHIHDCGMFLGNAPFVIFPQIDRAIEVIKRALLP